MYLRAFAGRLLHSRCSRISGIESRIRICGEILQNITSSTSTSFSFWIDPLVGCGDFCLRNSSWTWTQGNAFPVTIISAWSDFVVVSCRELIRPQAGQDISVRSRESHSLRFLIHNLAGYSTCLRFTFPDMWKLIISSCISGNTLKTPKNSYPKWTIP